MYTTTYEDVQAEMKFLQELLKVEVNAAEYVTTTQHVFLLNGGETLIHIQLLVQTIAKSRHLVIMHIPLQHEPRIGVFCMSKVN